MSRGARLASVSRPFGVYRVVSNAARDLPARADVGNKAFNLMVMARAGLPVPPGFVLGTELCRAYMQNGRRALAGIEAVFGHELEILQQQTGRRFGDPRRPLLVSVRSGAAVSMPGMMETVLNVGLNAETLSGLRRLTGNPRLALDCRRRFIEQYGEVVHELEPRRFEEIIASELRSANATSCSELDTLSLRTIVARHETVFEEAVGECFPVDPMAQLMATVESVLQSWSSERAKSYRALNNISGDAGTATLIQAMVFGNAGPTSGSGVGFTRNPADGTDALYIDYLANAQGEDVVAGRRNALGAEQLQRRAPQAYAELIAHKDTLEKTFGDMQDFEFTIEDGKLFMLQARNGKRTPLAALRIAHDLVAGGIMTADAAVEKLSGIDLDQIEYLDLVVPEGVQPIGRAVSAGTGIAVGAAVFDSARMKAVKRDGTAILLRENAETADIAAIAEADALITARGARTSHAAVVARQLGKVCLVACGGLKIDASARSCRIGEATVREGDVLSVDGASGLIYAGRFAIRRAKPTEMLAEIKSWAEGIASRPDDKADLLAVGSKEGEPPRRDRTNLRQRNIDRRDKKR